MLEGYDFYRYIMEERIQFDDLAQFMKENALAILRANR